MLRCPLKLATKARKDALMELEQSLDDMGTHPDLTSLILAVSLDEKPPCNEAESDIGLRDIIIAQ